jgi:hypothetical protein
MLPKGDLTSGIHILYQVEDEGGCGRVPPQPIVPPPSHQRRHTREKALGELYKATFPRGSKVRVVSRTQLDDLARDWKYHHKLRPEQMECAGMVSTVKGLSFYHGGDQLYELENLPGIWNEPCLEAADEEPDDNRVTKPAKGRHPECRSIIMCH